MKILIAEDERITRMSLQRQLEQWGHEVVAAEDGAEAWSQFQCHPFDIVVSDWDMPRVDGRELIQRIRGVEQSHYAYLIMLTGRSEAADLVAGMEAGADDFLAKPFDRDELRVRLRAGERIIQLERRLAAQNQILQTTNKRMKRGLDAAARVQQTLLPDHLPEPETARFAWAYRPCDELAGDALNIVQISERLIALYVLDVSGHGVPAALLSVTATRSLSPHAGEPSLTAGSEPDSHIVSPAQVASALNALYPMESNGGHYFTLLYGILDTQTRQFRFASAGHPGPILLRSGATHYIETSSLAIGMFRDADYEDTVLELQPGDRLYVRSDGVDEEMDANEQQFGKDRLQTAIVEAQAATLEESVESLIGAVVAWRGDENLHDDVSVLAVEIL